MGVQRARDRREERPDDEREQAWLHDPDPDRLGRHPILALGEHLPAVRRALQPPDDVDGHERPTTPAHHRFVYGATFENVRDPRVNESALNSTTRTMTRNPSVATATKWPDSRISTRPTSQAIGRDEDAGDHASRRGTRPGSGRAGCRGGRRPASREVRQVVALLAQRQREDRRDVRAERHEPDVTEREHAGEAARQVERDDEDDEDRRG